MPATIWRGLAPRPWPVLVAVLAAALATASDASTPVADRLTGYSAPSSRTQRDLEARFKAIPSADQARAHHRYFTSEPHPAGSARNNELADHIARIWKEQGWEDVTVHRYDVLVSDPREVVVEMVSPVPYRARLREDAYDEDPDTKNPAVRGGYLGLSASGDVTAEVVYAHSGNPEDYALLRRHGIDVKGKIALVRYSNPYSYRGFKALTAEREGLAAVLIYSIPRRTASRVGPCPRTALGAREPHPAGSHPTTSWPPATRSRRGGHPYPARGA